jgi:hypothetical protein
MLLMMEATALVSKPKGNLHVDVSSEKIGDQQAPKAAPVEAKPKVQPKGPAILNFKGLGIRKGKVAPHAVVTAES